MGLDIYVGSLTRYCTGDWKTIVQQFAEEQGYAFQTVRAGDFTLAGRVRRLTDRLLRRRGPNKDEVRGAVIAWRAALTHGLGGDLREPLHWDESDEAPYFTDKPAWDGYAGLLLLAAHDEHPDLPRPETVPEKGCEEDPAWRASTAETFRSRYRQLLTPGLEIWFPCAFEFTFRAPDISGREVGIGSSVALLEQLRELNARTFRGSAEDLERWRRENAEFGGPFELTARFGLAVLLELTEKSVAHRLPMKLDY